MSLESVAELDQLQACIKELTDKYCDDYQGLHKETNIEKLYILECFVDSVTSVNDDLRNAVNKLITHYHISHDEFDAILGKSII